MNEKENYYKIYDGRNRLRLVTPTPRLAKKWIAENSDIPMFLMQDRNMSSGATGQSHFFGEYRVQMINL